MFKFYDLRIFDICQNFYIFRFDFNQNQNSKLVYSKLLISKRRILNLELIVLVFLIIENFQI